MRNSFLVHAVLVALAILTPLFLLSSRPVLADNSSTNYPVSVTPASKFIPAETTVAILPVINITKSKHPDKDAEMQAKQVEKANGDLAEAFGQHDFKVVDPTQVAQAMQKSHFDAANQAFWTPNNLAAIGNAVHADLVVLMIITDTHQGFRHGFLILGAQREGEAKTKLWLVDTQTQSAIIDGVTAAGKSQASALSGWATGGMGEGSSAYVLKAIGDATDKSLKDFFKPYPADKNRETKYVVPNPQSPMGLPAVAPTPSRALVAPSPHTVASAPPQSLFVFVNGGLAVGTVLGFDGSIYRVSTTKGFREFKAAWIKSITPIASAPVAATIHK